MFSIADQMLLSGMNFVIGLLFIQFAPKAEYAIYTQLFGIWLLLSMTQNALVQTPLISLHARYEGAAKKQLMRQSLYGLIALGLLSALIMLIASLFAADWGISAAPALPAFALMLFSMSLREFMRQLAFIQQRADLAFALDLIFGTLFAIGIVLNLQHLHADVVLLSMGLGSAVALLAAARFPGYRCENPHALKATFSLLWERGRWALPGVLVMWAVTHSYVYFASALISLEAAAELSAARLFAIPLNILFISWISVYQPRAGRWIHEQDWPHLWHIIRRSLGIMLGLIALYFLSMSFLLELFISWIMRDDYRYTFELALLWIGYFSINGLRWIASASLSSGGEFKTLFHYSFSSLLIALPGMAILAIYGDERWMMLGLIGAELLMALLTWQDILRRYRRPQHPSA